MWHHGNAELLVHICMAQQATFSWSPSENTWINLLPLTSGSCVYRVRSLKATHLHDVIDQRVAEHPVQVYALVLQNVLEEGEQIKDKKKTTWTLPRLFICQSRLKVYIRMKHRINIFSFSVHLHWHVQSLCRVLMNNCESYPSWPASWNLELHHIGFSPNVKNVKVQLYHRFPVKSGVLAESKLDYQKQKNYFRGVFKTKVWWCIRDIVDR